MVKNIFIIIFIAMIISIFFRYSLMFTDKELNSNYSTETIIFDKIDTFGEEIYLNKLQKGVVYQNFVMYEGSRYSNGKKAKIVLYIENDDLDDVSIELDYDFIDENVGDVVLSVLDSDIEKILNKSENNVIINIDKKYIPINVIELNFHIDNPKTIEYEDQKYMLGVMINSIKLELE